jgi:hypothetical protein
MNVVIPITIQFDCHHVAMEKPATTIWLRFDIEDLDDVTPVHWTRDDPYAPQRDSFGRDREVRWHEGGKEFFDFMPSADWVRIKKQAERWPSDYYADEAEGEAAQKLVDDARDQDRYAETGV